jgi:hypothetical protein
MEIDMPDHPLFKLPRKAKTFDSRFLVVKDATADPAHNPARTMMERAFDRLSDPDGNFVEQFQTSGHDARLWELYLNEVFVEFGYKPERPSPNPDFLLKHPRDANQHCCIECVTTNATHGRTISVSPGSRDRGQFDSAEYVNQAIRRFHNAIQSKIEKAYWDEKNCKNRPLVLALHLFHDEFSLGFCSRICVKYLFDEEILEVDGKPIPLGLFAKGEGHSRKISALMFSNCATSNKFMRMGRQIGIGAGHVTILRKCWMQDGSQFVHTIGDGSHNERWYEGLEIIHNPNADYPLSHDYFPDWCKRNRGRSRPTTRRFIPVIKNLMCY